MNEKNNNTFFRLNIGAVVDWQTYIKKKKRWYSPIADQGIDLLVLVFISSVFICATYSLVRCSFF